MPTTAAYKYERPLTDRTVAERKLLVLTAAAGLALNTGSVAQLLGFASMTAPSDMAKGAFFVAIAYLLVMFVVWASRDTAAWKTHQALWELRNAAAAAREVRNELRRLMGTESPTMARHLELAELHAREISAQYGSASRRSIVTQVIDHVRLFVFELGLPVALGGLALWKLWPYAIDFVGKVIST